MHPFTGTSGASLDNLRDLHAGLPFASGASPRGAPAAPYPPAFALPREPVAPAAPESSATARRLTRASYAAYAAALAAYVAGFAGFEAALLGRAAARHDADGRLVRRGGADGAGGVAALASGAADDERLLRLWSEAKGRFRAAMEEYVRVKGRVRELGLGGE